LIEESSNQLILKIIEDAKEQAKVIVEEAKVSTKRLLEEKEKEMREKANKARQEILQSSKTEAENIIHRESVDAIIKTRWILLTEKRKIMDNVFRKVEEKLQSFTKEKEYQNVLGRLIEEAAIAAGGGKLEILLNKVDSHRKLPLKDYSKKVSSIVGVETTIDNSNRTISTIGGVIVQSADEKTRIDNTLSAIIERERKRLEPKITAMLFPDKPE